jgi:hypothetical protein
MSSSAPCFVFADAQPYLSAFRASFGRLGVITKVEQGAGSSQAPLDTSPRNSLRILRPPFPAPRPAPAPLSLPPNLWPPSAFQVNISLEPDYPVRRSSEFMPFSEFTNSYISQLKKGKRLESVEGDNVRTC